MLTLMQHATARVQVLPKRKQDHCPPMASPTTKPLIEHIFGRHVKASQAETIEMLSYLLTEVWNAIMQET